MDLKSLVPRCFLPIVAKPYSHIFLDSTEISSSVMLHNHFSIISPNEDSSARFEIQIRDSDGNGIARQTLLLNPWQTVSASIREIFPELKNLPHVGTVSVKASPSRNYRVFARSIHRGVISLPSPFWMRFSAIDGSEAYVHSIEADYFDRGLVQSLLTRANRLMPTSCWESSRALRFSPADELSVYLINSGSRKHTGYLELVEQNGSIAEQIWFESAPGGVFSHSVTFSEAHRLFVRVKNLATHNSKPYILMRNQSGMFALTHG